MLERFLQFVNDKKLITATKPVLLAVSGGVDSVVMCRLFKEAGIHFGIAHCNFGLRGEESEGDERFVRGLAEQHNAPFHVMHFDTEQVAESEGISVQMAARRLRYEWFEEIRFANNYTAIATAHHLNDDVETFFINLVRGTGLAGLKGIPPRQGNIIRPLLFALREEVEAFARDKGMEWREDSSNLSDKYLRNKIRQSIIPSFKEISPSFESTIAADIRKLKDAFMIVEQHIEDKRKQLMKEQGSDVLLDIDGLKQLEPLGIYLYELLKPYSFKEPVINEIADSLDALPGKKFYSSTHRLLKDRTHFIVSPLSHSIENEVLINEDQQQVNGAVSMEFSVAGRENITTLVTAPNIAYLDKSRLQFPLVLRKWKQGDAFCPLGMKTKKKLSDFFIDNKFSLVEKERVWVLVSGGEIAWIAGHRIDDRFRITAATTEVLICKLTD
jgi:tRNA(Ile)-lysidine synthase